MWEKVVRSGKDVGNTGVHQLKGIIAHMFLGQYQHNLDDKGRLMIPARFRELLEGGAYITQGFDRCLMVMTTSYFKEVYRRINTMNLADPTIRLLRRMILANAYPVEVDKVGASCCPPLRQGSRSGWRSHRGGPGRLLRGLDACSLERAAGPALQDTEANNQRFAALDLSGKDDRKSSAMPGASRMACCSHERTRCTNLYFTKRLYTRCSPRNPGRYVDGTLGAGGHARGILEACAPDGRLLGLDVDPQALALARETLAPYGKRVPFWSRPPTQLYPDELAGLDWEAVDGIVLDLGVSSMQLDRPGARLLLPAGGAARHALRACEHRTSAADLVNTASEEELADLSFRYGEEPRLPAGSPEAIVQARPLRTTTASWRRGRSGLRTREPGSRIHPATRTFQALRIAVNEELAALEKVLPQALAGPASGRQTGGHLLPLAGGPHRQGLLPGGSRSLVNPPYEQIYEVERKALLKEITRKPSCPPRRRSRPTRGPAAQNFGSPKNLVRRREYQPQGLRQERLAQREHDQFREMP